MEIKRRKICRCGCGETIKNNQKFVHGHNRKGSKNSRTARIKGSLSRGKSGILIEDKPFLIKFCKCGCGQIVSRNAWTGEYADYINHHFHIKYHSKETKQKLRELNLGKKLTEKTRDAIRKAMIGKNTWMKGRKLSKETIKKGVEKRRGKPCSEETKRKLAMYIGPLASQWKGGISCEPYCDAWADKEYKKSILERDGYRCQNPDCWKTAKRLALHHIDYNKKNCTPWNMITLCTSCNTRANKNRKYWQKFYKEIMKTIKEIKESRNEQFKENSLYESSQKFNRGKIPGLVEEIPK